MIEQNIYDNKIFTGVNSDELSIIGNGFYVNFTNRELIKLENKIILNKYNDNIDFKSSIELFFNKNFIDEIIYDLQKHDSKNKNTLF